jgi:hypothetical protein
VNPVPPGSPLGTFVTGGMPQQYVHGTTAEIYKNTPLAPLGPKWDQITRRSPLTLICWGARYCHHHRGRGRR